MPLPLGAYGIIWVIRKDLDNYFVSAMYSPAQYAIYAIGWLEVPLISLFLESMLCGDGGAHQRAAPGGPGRGYPSTCWPAPSTGWPPCSSPSTLSAGRRARPHRLLLYQGLCRQRAHLLHHHHPNRAERLHLRSHRSRLHRAAQVHPAGSHWGARGLVHRACPGHPALWDDWRGGDSSARRPGGTADRRLEGLPDHWGDSARPSLLSPVLRVAGVAAVSALVAYGVRTPAASSRSSCAWRSPASASPWSMLPVSTSGGCRDGRSSAKSACWVSCSPPERGCWGKRRERL